MTALLMLAALAVGVVVGLGSAAVIVGICLRRMVSALIKLGEAKAQARADAPQVGWPSPVSDTTDQAIRAAKQGVWD